MKGLILCGGTGSRLRPLTYTGAKQLLPVANKSILFYALEALRDAGVSDIGIIVGETEPEIRRAVRDGSRWGAKLTFIAQQAPLGLAHAVLTAEDFIGEEPFVMFLGDNLIRDGVAGFVKQYEESRPNSLILLSKVKNPQRFGVAELEEGRVVRLVEKPKEPKSDLALVGVYIFDRHIFTAARDIKPSWRNELEITDAIQRLVETGYTVEPHLVNGWWKDTGKPEDLLEANRLILEELRGEVKGNVAEDCRLTGQVRIEVGTRVQGSTIRGPVVIGQNCTIINSYIGPFTSIGHGVTVLNSELECSIVMDDINIADVPARIDESLIGRNVRISGGKTKPLGVRLVLGDNSQVEF